MSVPVIFHRLAVQEARKAAGWYGRRSAILASRFRTAVSDAAQKISEDESVHRIADSAFSYVRVQRFPYCLIFKLTSAGIALVVAVAHNRRRPNYWRHRG